MNKLYEGKHMNKWGWNYFSEFVDIYRNRVWKKDLQIIEKNMLR